MNHTVKIIDDAISEDCPVEAFFSSISLLNDDPRITIIQNHAKVMIVDSMEIECSKYNIHMAIILFHSITLLQSSPHL